MQELVILSGKGGTGKTTITGALAALWKKVILVDCDVDAANLHLITRPVVQERHTFRAGQKARIDRERCTDCGLCLDYCRFNAIKMSSDLQLGELSFHIDELDCEGCGLCAHICPEQAIDMNLVDSGEWYLSETPFGPMVHGRLAPAEGNSGMLVTLLRNKARELAAAGELALTLVDGPPGISCPTIASLTGADYVLFVTEPSLSAFHDLRRVIDLVAHFRMPGGVLVNRYDINEEMTAEIEDYAREQEVAVLGRLAYDRTTSRAQLDRQTIVEHTGMKFGEQLRELHQNLIAELNRVASLKSTHLA